MPVRTTLSLALAVVLGIAVGIGSYTFGYAKGHSYLTDNPEACANCHIMNTQYEGWLKSSHRSVAVCNDCHTPKGIFSKYATKASNGFWHSFGFTTGLFPEPIRITPGNLEVAEQSCRFCHAPVVQAIDTHPGGRPLACTRCHKSAGHM